MRLQIAGFSLGVLCILIGHSQGPTVRAAPPAFPRICIHPKTIPVDPGDFKCKFSNPNCIADGNKNIANCSGGQDGPYACGASNGFGSTIIEGSVQGGCVNVIDPFVCTPKVENVNRKKYLAKCPAPTGGTCGGCNLTDLQMVVVSNCGGCDPF